jgi:hypothetical protein
VEFRIAAGNPSFRLNAVMTPVDLQGPLFFRCNEDEIPSISKVGHYGSHITGEELTANGYSSPPSRVETCQKENQRYVFYQYLQKLRITPINQMKHALHEHIDK